MDLDIAPFAHEVTGGEARILRWDEPRDIFTIVVQYPENASMPRSVKIEYWRDKWPDNRPREEDAQPGRSGRAAWKGMDDWFNGGWIEAVTRTKADGRRLITTFAPLKDELPAAEDYNVTFRRTMQVRLGQGVSGCESIAIFTGTTAEEREIRIELGCGLKGDIDCGGDIRVYNGYLKHFPGFHDGRTTISIVSARPRPLSHDSTVVTVRSSLADFSFRPDDLDLGPIWITDLKALVSVENQDIEYSPDLVREIKEGQTVYDMIGGEPEQTLRRALREQPPKRPMHFIIGTEGRRQKFGIEPNGDIFAGLGFIKGVPGPDTERLQWNARRLYFRFHWEQMIQNGRFLEEGYLPIHRATFSRGALDITQEAFATLITGDLSDPVVAEDPVMAMVRLVFRNAGDGDLHIDQSISSECLNPRSSDRLVIHGGRIHADAASRALRMIFDRAGRGRLSVKDGNLRYRLTLAGGETHAVVVKIPFLDLLSPEEVEELSDKRWEEEHRRVRAYWKSRVAQGTQIRTGIQDIDDFHRALLTHILINDDHEVGSNRVIGRVSSFNYGNFSNEAVMQIVELDRRGLHDEAERHLATYLHYQGTVPLPGDFSGKEGLFYGSGGYEHGDYNQHHGWVLWGLAEHYRYSGDKEWLRRIAHKLVAGCEWVMRERSATMQVDGAGNRSLEYGYLPAGPVEDVREYCYWLSTNALTYRGLEAAGSVLTEIGHPDGKRITKDAAEYRRSILDGIRESMIRSPVVRLRDGTYIPHVPSRLHWRGRDVGWIREVLEGSITAVGTVLDPADQISTWIMKDFEDNRYLDLPFNYALDEFEAQWFSRGGFSMQPNLIYALSPYLDRDQIPHYLRAFFNSFAACWRAEIRSMTEHPLPTLADWKGDHFKSSDESMVSYSMRSMFVHEENGDLFLGKGIPRRWLEPGSAVRISRARTHFGQVDLSIAVDRDGSEVSVVFDPPVARKPDRIFLRLRHPSRWKIDRVEGAEIVGTLGDGETIEIPVTEGKLELKVSFKPAQPKADPE